MHGVIAGLLLLAPVALQAQECRTGRRFALVDGKDTIAVQTLRFAGDSFASDIVASQQGATIRIRGTTGAGDYVTGLHLEIFAGVVVPPDARPVQTADVTFRPGRIEALVALSDGRRQMQVDTVGTMAFPHMENVVLFAELLARAQARSGREEMTYATTWLFTRGRRDQVTVDGGRDRVQTVRYPERQVVLTHDMAGGLTGFRRSDGVTAVPIVCLGR